MNCLHSDEHHQGYAIRQYALTLQPAACMLFLVFGLFKTFILVPRHLFSPSLRFHLAGVSPCCVELLHLLGTHENFLNTAASRSESSWWLGKAVVHGQTLTSKMLIKACVRIARALFYVVCVKTQVCWDCANVALFQCQCYAVYTGLREGTILSQQKRTFVTCVILLRKAGRRSWYGSMVLVPACTRAVGVPRKNLLARESHFIAF